MKRVLIPAAVGALGLFVALSALGPSTDTRRTTIGAFQIVQTVLADSSTTHVPEGDARQASVAAFAQLRPDLKGMTVSAANFAAGVAKATSTNGFIFSTGNPVNVWLVEASGPAQAGWDHVIGLAIVDATSGRVLASGIGAYND